MLCLMLMPVFQAMNAITKSRDRNQTLLESISLVQVCHLLDKKDDDDDDDYDLPCTDQSR